MTDLEEVMNGTGNWVQWEQAYRNTVEEMRTRARGPGALPSYDNKPGKDYLLQHLFVVETAQYQIGKVQEWMDCELKILNNLVRGAQRRSQSMRQTPVTISDQQGNALLGMRHSVLSGDAWQDAHILKTYLTLPPEHAGWYEHYSAGPWNRHFDRCGGIIESYSALYHALVVPNRPADGTAPTAIDRSDTSFLGRD